MEQNLQTIERRRGWREITKAGLAAAAALALSLNTACDAVDKTSTAEVSASASPISAEMPTDSNSMSSGTPTTESVSQALEYGGVWVAPVAARNSDGEVAVRPLAAVEGSVSCLVTQVGEIKTLSPNMVKWYTYDNGVFSEFRHNEDDEVVSRDTQLGRSAIQCIGFSTATGDMFDSNGIPVEGAVASGDRVSFFHLVKADNPIARKSLAELLSKKL